MSLIRLDFQVFSHILWVTFHFLDGMLEGSEVFNFDEGQFLFSFVSCAFFWCPKKSLLIQAYEGFLLCFLLSL